MAWAVVQHKNAAASSAAFSSNTTTGNQVIVVSTSGSFAITSIAISPGSGTFTKAVSVNNSTLGVTVEIWECPNVTGGTTPTVTCSGSGANPEITIFEFSGGDTGGATDGTNTQNSGGTLSASLTTNAITTTTNGDLVFKGFACGGTPNGTAQTGWTETNPTASGNITGYIVQSASGSITGTDTQTSSQYAGAIAAFKVAGGSGAQSVTPSGIASTVAFGTATITSVATIAPSGIASSVAFGTATLTSVATISPTGIPSSVAFGTATVGLVSSISPTGIASTVNFGLPTLTLGTQFIYPGGIPSSVVFGNTSLSGGVISASHLLDRWFNPRPWLGLNLGQSKDQKLFIHQLVDILVRLIALTRTTGNMNTSVYDTNNNGVVDTCDYLAWSKLTGTPNIAPGALAQLSISNAAVTTSQTIDCTGYAIVWLNYTLTGAISFTTTLNNLSSGAQVFWRVLNASGATRTLTLAANSPGANPYSVVANVWAGVATWSSGALVNNNAYGSISGVTSNVGTNWLLYGNGVNG